MRDGYSPDHLPLLWPPAGEAQANAEGWTLREAGGIVEVDYVPPRSSPEPIYHHLIGWIVLNIALGSRMHAIAWEFEYAANRAIYTDGKVPGDSMFLVYDEATDTTVWREWPFDDTAAEWPR
jgi:hypothetical protein